MLPVTGPFVSTIGGKTQTQRWKYKQAKPYNLKLPYRAYHGVNAMPGSFLAGLTAGGVDWPLKRTIDSGSIYYGAYEGAENRAKSMAIKAFNGSKGAAASLGAAVATSNQTLGMIASRSKQLYTAIKALKRFDGRAFLDALDLDFQKFKTRERLWIRSGKNGPVTLKNEALWQAHLDKFKLYSRKRRLKQSADLWLEYSYGWAPLIGDISDAVKVLNSQRTQPIPCMGYGRSDIDFKQANKIVGPAYTEYSDVTHICKIKVNVKATLTFTDSSTAAVTMLGLTNLPSVIYELTPWSFVANYFINLEEFLSQASVDLGMSIADPHWSVTWQDDVVITTWRRLKPLNGGPEGPIVDFLRGTRKAVSFERYVGSLPTFNLGLRLRYANNVTRAINNVALLIGLVKNVR